jgi:hypothetical protein
LQNVAIPDNNAGIVTKLKDAMSQWRKYIKAEGAEDRNTFLQKKATAIAEEKNTTLEKIMRQLRLGESQKRVGTQIKMVRGKLRSGGVFNMLNYVLSCSELFIFKYIYRQSLTPHSPLFFNIEPQTSAHPNLLRVKIAGALIEIVRYTR